MYLDLHMHNVKIFEMNIVQELKQVRQAFIDHKDVWTSIARDAFEQLKFGYSSYQMQYLIWSK